MGDITSGCTIREVTPNAGLKLIQINTAATADSGDTIVLTLADYGIRTLLGINGVTHTTANSVIVAEAPTTSVTTGVLTITTGGSGATDQIRSYLVWGK